MNADLILLVEDESAIADVVVHVLAQDGFKTVTATDGTECLAMLRRFKPDLVILDLGLPGISGLDLFHRMRGEWPDLPVIILTARTEEIDRVAGLEMGADDYVTKPFSSRELVARVRTVLRRSRRAPAAPSHVLSAGPLTLDMQQLRFTCDGQPVRMSLQEMKLMECLMRHPARIFARDVLLNLIYDGETYVTERSIDAQVRRIRKGVAEAAPGLDPIQTVYGMGYKFSEALGRE